MKPSNILLLVLLFILQCQLWIGNGSLTEVHHLEGELAVLSEKNDLLTEKNRMLVVEVRDLKKGKDSLEERARHDLGMIGRGEVFYQIVRPQR